MSQEKDTANNHSRLTAHPEFLNASSGESLRNILIQRMLTRFADMLDAEDIALLNKADDESLAILSQKYRKLYTQHSNRKDA